MCTKTKNCIGMNGNPVWRWQCLPPQCASAWRMAWGMTWGSICTAWDHWVPSRTGCPTVHAWWDASLTRYCSSTSDGRHSTVTKTYMTQQGQYRAMWSMKLACVRDDVEQSLSHTNLQFRDPFAKQLSSEESKTSFHKTMQAFLTHTHH